MFCTFFLESIQQDAGYLGVLYGDLEKSEESEEEFFFTPEVSPPMWKQTRWGGDTF